MPPWPLLLPPRPLRELLLLLAYLELELLMPL